MAGVQQAQGDLEIDAGHPARFRRSADRVVQAGTRIPDRIPDPVGHRRDPGPAVVQQQNIEVAAGKQFTAPVPAQRDESYTGLRAQQGREPAVRVQAPAGTIRGEGCQGRPVGLWTGRGG